MTSQMIATGKDNLGRWVWAKLRRYKKKDLLLVQIYISQANYELYTSATQQYVELCTPDTKSPNIKDSFATDLRTLLNNHNTETIIMGDFNLPVEDPFIRRIITENDLFDTTQICGRQHQRNIHTYKRGKSKIDYALATWGLLPDIDDVVYGDFDTYCDHRPLFLP